MGAAATVADSPWPGAEARQPLGESVPMTPQPLPVLGPCRAACWVSQADAPKSHSSLTTFWPLQMPDLLPLESFLILGVHTCQA